jgi:predicted transcriptional regulator
MIKYIRERTIIPDEFMNAFRSKTLYIIQNGAADQISSKYSLLSDLVSMYTRGRQYENNKWFFYENIEESNVSNTAYNTFVFQMGQLDSYITLINDVLSNKNEIEAFSTNRAYFEKNINIFKTISSDPGINHAKLANKVGKSPSALSQFVSKIRAFDYITQTSIGREKYYYLTTKGQNILKDLEKTVDNTMSKYSSYYSVDDYQFTGLKGLDSNNGPLINFLQANLKGKLKSITMCQSIEIRRGFETNTYTEFTVREFDEGNKVEFKLEEAARQNEKV